MKMLNKFILLVPIILLHIFAYSQQTEGFVPSQNLDEIKQKIATSSISVNSLSSNFTQEKHLTMMEEVLVSKGNFLFKKENKVCWTYTQPIDYSIVINDNKFEIQNEGKVSTFDISSNKMFSEINQMILMAIQGNFLDSKEFSAAFFENNQFFKITLSPLNEQVAKMLVSIEIYFNKTDTSVSKVKFIEPGDDFTLIIFTDRKLNIDIPDNVFSTENE